MQKYFRQMICIASQNGATLQKKSMKEELDDQIVVRMPRQLRRAVERLATQDRRKLSDYVRLQLEKVVETEKAKKKSIEQ